LRWKLAIKPDTVDYFLKQGVWGVSEIRIEATVDRIEEDQAVLLLATPHGELPVNWPVALLPPGVGEGSKLDFAIGENRQAEADARQRVADLLEELTRRKD
jgi:hypothetical protein